MNVLNTDPSAQVPINIRQGKSFGWTQTFDAPPTGTWEIVFSYDEAGKQIVEGMSLTEGDGITTAGAVMTIHVAKADNNLKQGQIYWRMSQTVGSEGILAFWGPVNVLP